MAPVRLLAREIAAECGVVQVSFWTAIFANPLTSDDKMGRKLPGDHAPSHT
jgi:hypothetical protein